MRPPRAEREPLQKAATCSPPNATICECRLRCAWRGQAHVETTATCSPPAAPRSRANCGAPGRDRRAKLEDVWRGSVRLADRDVGVAVEAVANTANGANDVFVVTELAAQSADVYVDGALVGHVVVVS